MTIESISKKIQDKKNEDQRKRLMDLLDAIFKALEEKNCTIQEASLVITQLCPAKLNEINANILRDKLLADR